MRVRCGKAFRHQVLETVKEGERMELYYLPKYPIRLCRDYMTHFNIYNIFVYVWEERGLLSYNI